MTRTWTSETGLVNACKKAILARWPDALIWKIHGDYFQEVGIPDLVLCVEGRFVGLEVKDQKPGESYAHAIERTTPGQRMQLNRIGRAGGTGRVVTTPDEAVAAVETALATPGWVRSARWE